MPICKLLAAPKDLWCFVKQTLRLLEHGPDTDMPVKDNERNKLEKEYRRIRSAIEDGRRGTLVKVRRVGSLPVQAAGAAAAEAGGPAAAAGPAR